LDATANGDVVEFEWNDVEDADYFLLSADCEDFAVEIKEDGDDICEEEVRYDIDDDFDDEYDLESDENNKVMVDATMEVYNEAGVLMDEDSVSFYIKPQDDDDGDEEDAEDAIADAEEEIEKAEEVIEDADNNGKETELSKDTLEDAEDLLADAKEALEDEDFEEAEELAEESEDLAKDARMKFIGKTEADIADDDDDDDDDSDDDFSLPSNFDDLSEDEQNEALLELIIKLLIAIIALQ